MMRRHIFVESTFQGGLPKMCLLKTLLVLPFMTYPMTVSFAQSSSESDSLAFVQSKFEALPILSYDTDVGFGYGAKGFFLNFLGWGESFDAIVFNSTKGERWYRIVFSLPDFELRQGKEYPLSIDIVLDYDKYTANNFFAIGSESRSSARETYTKEPLELQLVMGRGFNRRIVGQLGVKFKTVRNFNHDITGLFAGLSGINLGQSRAFTMVVSFRYDSRNSFINPSYGDVAQCDLEAGSSGLGSDYDLLSSTVLFQVYRAVYPNVIFAARVMARSVSGSNLPIHSFATLGGTQTLRGFPQDRFLDRASLLTNWELRFPLFWRFGGIVFYDAGTMGSGIERIQLFSRWKASPGLGLRLIMDTFVVRADLGVSNEGSGFYFNFGHLF